MTDLRILVTGASGLIGSYTTKFLHESGCSVVALFRKLDERETGVPWSSVQGDLLDVGVVRNLMRVEFDMIVHCAAVVPSGFYGSEADQAARANSVIDERVMDLCLIKSSRLVYLSGTSVYGTGGSLPLTEEADLSPIGPYVKAKAQSEKRILNLMPESSAILRVSSPYGPGQRARTVLRLFIERSLANLDLTYHGSGKREQDFIAAQDVARAISCAVSNPDVCGTFNIAGGNPVSMKDLAELVVRTVRGTRSNVLASGQPDPQENYKASFDIDKARRILGWHPTISLRDGILQWAEYLSGRR